MTLHLLRMALWVLLWRLLLALLLRWVVWLGWCGCRRLGWRLAASVGRCAGLGCLLLSLRLLAGLLRLRLALLLLRLSLWLTRLALRLLTLRSLLTCHLTLLLHVRHAWVHRLTWVRSASHLRIGAALLRLPLDMLLLRVLLLLLLMLSLLLLLKCQLLR